MNPRNNRTNEPNSLQNLIRNVKHSLSRIQRNCAVHNSGLPLCETSLVTESLCEVPLYSFFTKFLLYRRVFGARVRIPFHFKYRRKKKTDLGSQYDHLAAGYYVPAKLVKYYFICLWHYLMITWQAQPHFISPEKLWLSWS